MGILLKSFEILLKSYRVSIEILSNFYRNSIEILSAFYRHSIEILSKFYRNSIEIVSKFFRNSIEILSELYRNSIEILSKFYRNSSSSYACPSNACRLRPHQGTQNGGATPRDKGLPSHFVYRGLYGQISLNHPPRKWGVPTVHVYPPAPMGKNRGDQPSLSTAGYGTVTLLS